MKKLILSLIVAVAAQAHAYDVGQHYCPPNVYSFPMRGEIVDPYSNLFAYDDGDDSYVQLDYNRETIKLFTPSEFRCPAGTMCSMVMPAPFNFIELPMIGYYVDECGVLEIYAEIDNRMVDGTRTAITFVDQMNNTCRGPIEAPRSYYQVYVEEEANYRTGEHYFAHSRFGATSICEDM